MRGSRSAQLNPSPDEKHLFTVQLSGICIKAAVARAANCAWGRCRNCVGKKHGTREATGPIPIQVAPAPAAVVREQRVALGEKFQAQLYRALPMAEWPPRKTRPHNGSSLYPTSDLCRLERARSPWRPR